jgi:hypothetical protein
MRGPREHKKRQETNGKRDRTSSGQIVTIVFVSSLLHQVSLSSHAHNFNYTFTVQSMREVFHTCSLLQTGHSWASDRRPSLYRLSWTRPQKIKITK